MKALLLAVSFRLRRSVKSNCDVSQALFTARKQVVPSTWRLGCRCRLRSGQHGPIKAYFSVRALRDSCDGKARKVTLHTTLLERMEKNEDCDVWEQYIVK